VTERPAPDGDSPHTDPRSRISLAVVTRDRPGLLESYSLPGLRRAAASGFDVAVVDQSRDSDTEALVRRVPGIRYLRSAAGLSVGRNVAIEATEAPVLAFTDDDVTIEGGWLEGMLDILDRYPRAGVVCGVAVDPRGHLRPGTKPGVYRWPSDPFNIGSGFNIAFRREALRAVGPFDEDLGAGTRYGAGEDTDMLYRIMRAGWLVVCSADVSVVHQSWRSPGQETAMHYRYGLGAGAQIAKHMAAGDRAAAGIGRRLAGRHLSWLVRWTVRLRPTLVLWQIAYLRGLVTGYRRRRRELRERSRPGPR
jgi:GT2 family glycosyltransferase